ncbi:hypothetical protein [Pectobacterium versatile]|uniref:hypothetical protein n=1 Tax=Pectobacterium versatile TaxID=2488639 RepID=UPI001CCFB32A|nr:hypothetical protein [Pectobacterium versatile]
MHLSEHKKNIFCTLLSGAISPFPIIYDAVSEQVLLLILKARQLNKDPKFSQWFAEQHMVLTKLRALSKKIEEIYQNNNYPYDFNEKNTDSLMSALIFMNQLYAGFDKGNVSLKTWREMNRHPTEQGSRFAQHSKLLEEFIQDDMFAILEDLKNCSPIPPEARKGYCHQDLSIAHSCSNELLSRLNHFHEIDSLPILAEAIYDLITELRNHNIAIPAWLIEFEKVYTNFLLPNKRETPIFHVYIKLINDEGLNNFIERIVEQCEPHYADYLINQFKGIYASEIMQWLSHVQMYFKYAQSTPFIWKFNTVKHGISTVSEEEEQQTFLAWDSDYCQISIKRETLLQLIQSATLYDAADSLADCLMSIYRCPAEQMLRNKGAIPAVTDTECEVKSSDDWLFNTTYQGNFLKIIHSLQSFEEWHEKNKTLLISRKNTRTERVSVEVRQAGLKSYDLYMGIPDGNKIKIKDGVYDLVKKDPTLRIEDTISNVSLQRYHSQVRKIIEKDIDSLLLQQQNYNSKHPYSGSYHSIKPLWGKSPKHEEK